MIHKSQKNYLGSLWGFTPEHGYAQGELIFDILSLFIGTGEIKAALTSYKQTKSLSKLKNLITKSKKKTKNISQPEKPKALPAPEKPNTTTPIINSDGSITTHYKQNQKAINNNFTTYGKKIRGIRYKKFKDELASIKTETKYINQMFKSSSSLPKIVKISRDMELYKIVPKNGKIHPKSPYWMTKEELIRVFNSDKGIENLLALPEESCTGVYEIYKITLKDDTNLKKVRIFESTIAPSSQGTIKRKGGAKQTLVPDRDMWTDAVKIKEFKIEQI